MTQEIRDGTALDLTARLRAFTLVSAGYFRAEPAHRTEPLQVIAIRVALETIRQPFLGKIIRSLRAEAGLSQQQLGNRLKVNQSAVSAWEHGRGPGGHGRVWIL